MRYITGTLLAFCLFAILPSITQAASFTTDDFITTWDTTKAGTSASNQITIPGTGSGYSYSIYWESLSSTTATGTIATSTSASQTITFPEPGEYKVAIKGTYPRIYFNNGGDKLKILTVEQWGSNPWTSTDSAFYGCANLTVPATDAPNLSGVTNMRFMFYGTSLNNPVNHWDISNIENMQYLFRGTPFNQPLDNWNTSNVTNLLHTFAFATSFNQPLNMWNTSKVTDMGWTFYNATSFNQPLDNWDTSNVTRMTIMFGSAKYSNHQPTTFNQPLDNWDTSNVTQMNAMFSNNSSFNQTLNAWNVSKVTNLSEMFSHASSFNQALNNWNVASTTNMTDMFLNATLSQSNLDSTLSSWAAQSLKSNVPFHLGLKTYSSTGQTALNTLRDTYNWTITEQYQAEYQEGEDYTISGTAIQSPINDNGTTTAVEVIPNNRCTFINWSDNNTANPRTDTLTDNLTVSAIVECPNPSKSNGTSAATRYKKLLEFGNTAEAEAVKDRYLVTTSSNPDAPTLETVSNNIKLLITNPAINNNLEYRQQLISILQQLVQILRGMTGASS
uniref:Uncharacterized protein n=1 Tax=Candidatus Nitrotoga fabula TaxID=2182327 RepID=A0A2X0SJY5_9PROT|nr:exported protein of unknown function [Candidatus Nitrotoga fabula]